MSKKIEKALGPANSNGMLPNAFQTPNVFIDKYGFFLTDTERWVFMWACRHILGWRDKIYHRCRRISVSTFENGFTGFAGCGYGRAAIIKALDGLSRYGMLVKDGEPTADGQMWRIPEDDESIDLDGMISRYHERQEVNKNRTKNATIKALNRFAGTSDVPGIGTCHEPLNGTSDEPRLVRPTNQEKYVGRTKAGTSDEHIQNQLGKPTLKNQEREGAHSLIPVVTHEQLSAAARTQQFINLQPGIYREVVGKDPAVPINEHMLLEFFIELNKNPIYSHPMNDIIAAYRLYLADRGPRGYFEKRDWELRLFLEAGNFSEFIKRAKAKQPDEQLLGTI